MEHFATKQKNSQTKYPFYSFGIDLLDKQTLPCNANNRDLNPSIMVDEAKIKASFILYYSLGHVLKLQIEKRTLQKYVSTKYENIKLFMIFERQKPK